MKELAIGGLIMLVLAALFVLVDRLSYRTLSILVAVFNAALLVALAYMFGSLFVLIFNL